MYMVRATQTDEISKYMICNNLSLFKFAIESRANGGMLYLQFIATRYMCAKIRAGDAALQLNKTEKKILHSDILTAK